MNATEETKEKPKWLKILFNKYLLVTLGFIIWMLFFDQNSFLIHRELDKEIKVLKQDREIFSEKLESEKSKIEKMKQDSAEIERIARERHFLKKDNEDIFVVEKQEVKPPATK